MSAARTILHSMPLALRTVSLDPPLCTSGGSLLVGSISCGHLTAPTTADASSPTPGHSLACDGCAVAPAANVPEAHACMTAHDPQHHPRIANEEHPSSRSIGSTPSSRIVLTRSHDVMLLIQSNLTLAGDPSGTDLVTLSPSKKSGMTTVALRASACSVCVCVCVYVRACVRACVCVCICVQDRTTRDETRRAGRLASSLSSQQCLASSHEDSSPLTAMLVHTQTISLTKESHIWRLRPAPNP
jgi:hypothetical protein